jgi:hypothetical protein
MHRRDVLKALVSLPVVAAFGGCNEKTEPKPVSNILEVHLEGAFALVIQENKANSILAFSPRPKKGDEPHQFYLNGSLKPEGSEKSLNFKVSTGGSERDSKPEISPGLKDFLFETEHWSIGDSLVSVELPAPRRITFSGHRSLVQFSDNRKAFMATNHILEYNLKDSERPTLECNDATKPCDPSPDSFSGVTRFFFEIGPKRSLDLVRSHKHATTFFNYILQQSFPDLQKQYMLIAEPSDHRQAHASFIPSIIPAVFQNGSHGPSLQRASYVVDCEFGGPLVLTHTPPKG